MLKPWGWSLKLTGRGKSSRRYIGRCPQPHLGNSLPMRPARSSGAGGHLQAQIKAAHHLAVDGGHRETFHGETAGNLGAHDGRGPEVVCAHGDDQLEDCAHFDLTRRLDGKTKGADF